MGTLSSSFRFFWFRVVPIIVVIGAIFVGWLFSHEIPEGVLFATIFPLSKGFLPPSIFGHGRVKTVPKVPDDMMPQPRPKNEMFVKLAGSSRKKMPQNGLQLIFIGIDHA